MKRSILALCVLTALGAGAANAQSNSTSRSNSTTTTSTSGAMYRPVLHYDTAADPQGSTRWWDDAVMQSTTRSSTVEYDISNQGSMEESRRNETRIYNERMNDGRMNSDGMNNSSTVERSTVERTRTNSTTTEPMMSPSNDGMVRPGTMERDSSVRPTP